jgi:hypothetical protein
MPQAYAVGWSKFVRCGLEDAKVYSLKVEDGMPIVISDQIRSGC